MRNRAGTVVGVGLGALCMALAGCGSTTSESNGSSDATPDSAVVAPKGAATFNPDPVEGTGSKGTAVGVMQSLFAITQGGYGIGASCAFDGKTAVNLIVVQNSADEPIIIQAEAGSSQLTESIVISSNPTTVGCSEMGSQSQNTHYMMPPNSTGVLYLAAGGNETGNCQLGSGDSPCTLNLNLAGFPGNQYIKLDLSPDWDGFDNSASGWEATAPDSNQGFTITTCDSVNGEVSGATDTVMWWSDVNYPSQQAICMNVAENWNNRADFHLSDYGYKWNGDYPTAKDPGDSIDVNGVTVNVMESFPNPAGTAKYVWDQAAIQKQQKQVVLLQECGSGNLESPMCEHALYTGEITKEQLQEMSQGKTPLEIVMGSGG